MSYRTNKEREKQLNNVFIALQTLCKRDIHHTGVPHRFNGPRHGKSQNTPRRQYTLLVTICCD